MKLFLFYSIEEYHMILHLLIFLLLILFPTIIGGLVVSTYTLRAGSPKLESESQRGQMSVLSWVYLC